MSTAKVIELISEGDSIQEAIENGVKEASKSIHGIKGVWVEGIKAKVKDGKVEQYRVDCKISFVID